MAKEMDELRDHAYDGIQEYDNDLPGWWVGLFYFTIIFGVGYIWYFHYGPGDLPHAELEKSMAEIQVMQAKSAKASAGGAAGGQNLAALVGNEDILAKGKEIFARCIACHGAGGEGTVGPNLTDKYWIHGGSLQQIRNTIAEGVPDKGMLAWKAMMSPTDLDAVTIYVASLAGTNPANPKAPQGDPVE